jgi:hypothetical protein
MADPASFGPDASTSDTHVPDPRPAPRHRERTGEMVEHLAHVVDLTPADLAAQVTLAHVLDVTDVVSAVCCSLLERRPAAERARRDVDGVRHLPRAGHPPRAAAGR